MGRLVLGSSINEKHKAKKFHSNIPNMILTTLFKNAAVFSQEVKVTLYLAVDE